MKRFFYTRILLSFLLCHVPAGNVKADDIKQIPALVKAKDIHYDPDLGLVTARGDVEITQEGRVLEADTVTYNEKTDTATATGHVRLREATGDIIFADFVQLDEDFTYGFSKRVRILLKDDARLTAAVGRRTGKNVTQYEQATYSSCQMCEGESPTWRLKAQHVKRDTDEKFIAFTDAHMELLGVPIFYTPYSSTPLERKSGFLFPTIGSTPNLGFFGAVPYYGVIDESSDVTVTPYILSRQNVVLALEGRKRFNAGSVKVSGSVTRPRIDATTAKVFKEDEVLYKKGARHHTFAEGQFSLNEHWRSSFDLQRTSDQTYLRRYPFMGHTADPYLTSTANAEYFSGRNYGAIAAYHFQGLRQGDRERRSPLILPVVDYRFVSAQRKWGDYFTVDTNLFSMYRHEGLNMRRGVVKAAWHVPYLTEGGHSFLLSTSVRGDGYHTKEEGLLAAKQERNKTTGRFFPQATLEWRYPLVTIQRENKWIVEPIAQIVGAPGHKNPTTLANEDSAGFELSDVNIFHPNRVPGYDRIDSGSRMNYGFQVQFNGPDVGANSFLLGQSYNITDPDSFFTRPGITDKISDYMGLLKLAPRDYLSLSHRFRFARKGLKRQMNESVLGLGPAIARLGVTYTFVDKDVNSTRETFEQAGIGLTSQFTKYWTAGIAVQRDLGKKSRTLSKGVSLGYQDDCFGAQLSVMENYYADRDIEPGKTFMFFVMFKNLGAYSYGVNPDAPGPFVQQ